MFNPTLILPTFTEIFREEYISFMDERMAANRWWGVLPPKEIRSDFPRYVHRLEECREGINLKEGWVPSTEFWVTDEDHLIGRVSLRHRLTPALERFGGHAGYDIVRSRWGQGYGTFALRSIFPHAQNLGLLSILLTCDDSNAASIRIIEKNGGTLQDKIQNEGRNVPTRRYWIGL